MNELPDKPKTDILLSMKAVCAWISVPVLNIAFTMQTFAVMLILAG